MNGWAVLVFSPEHLRKISNSCFHIRSTWFHQRDEESVIEPVPDTREQHHYLRPIRALAGGNPSEQP